MRPPAIIEVQVAADRCAGFADVIVGFEIELLVFCAFSRHQSGVRDLLQRVAAINAMPTQNPQIAELADRPKVAILRRN